VEIFGDGTIHNLLGWKDVVTRVFGGDRRGGDGRFLNLTSVCGCHVRTVLIDKTFTMGMQTKTMKLSNFMHEREF